MPHYRNLSTGRFVKSEVYERSVESGTASNFRAEFSAKELAKIAEGLPDAEEIIDYDDIMSEGFEADEEDEY